MHRLLACAGLLWIAAAHADTPLELEAFRGRVLYVDFWASWCTPCRQSFPWMQTMNDGYEQQGLTIIAVNLDRERSDAERFLSKFRPTFAVRFDPRGAVAEHFKVRGMPTSVIIDRQGTVRFTHIGFRPEDGAVYEAQLRDLLKEK